MLLELLDTKMDVNPAERKTPCQQEFCTQEIS